MREMSLGTWERDRDRTSRGIYVFGLVQELGFGCEEREVWEVLFGRHGAFYIATNVWAEDPVLDRRLKGPLYVLFHCGLYVGFCLVVWDRAPIHEYYSWSTKHAVSTKRFFAKEMCSSRIGPLSSK
jgi:hypothetical protein